MLFTLQRRGKATAAELAEELEVSVRTLYRDVASLSAAGVPVWTETGPGGGVRLMDGWRTRLDGLTADEASALFLSGAPKAVSDLGLATLAVSARAKLDATLPEPLRARAAQLRERIHFDAPGWFSRPEQNPALPIVAEAVWSNRRLDLRYGHGDKQGRRRVDPLGLVLKAGTWYLVARHRGKARTFRVSRIQGAQLLSETFERPEAFSLPNYWSAASLDFESSLLRFPCRVRLSPMALRRLPQVVPQDAVLEMIRAAGPPDAEGWREVALKLESEPVAADQLASLGHGVEVLTPLSLRRHVHELALRLASRNAPPRSAASFCEDSVQRAEL